MIPDYEESEGPRSMIHNMREFPLKFKSLPCVFFPVFLFTHHQSPYHYSSTTAQIYARQQYSQDPYTAGATVMMDPTQQNYNACRYCSLDRG